MFTGMARSGHTWRHYAWLIVLIASAGQMLGAAIRMAFGVLVTPLEESFGWSPGAIGLAYAWMSITTALLSPVSGWMSARFGARNTMAAGVALFLAGMIWTSQVTQLWQFHLAYGVIFGTAQALFLVPAVPAIASWFRRHLGLAMGIAMVSWSLGPALMVQGMAVLFEAFGWSATMLITGFVGAAGLGILLIFFKDSPEKAGKLAYGWEPGDRPLVTTGAQYATNSRRFQGAIYRTDAFWNLINIHFLGCVGHAVILVGIVPMAVHRGVSFPVAAGVLTTIAATSIVSRFLTPILGDRIGSKGTMFWSFLGQGAFVLLFLFANSAFEFYLFAVIWAIPYGGEGTVFPVINRKYYGHVPMGPTYGWQLLGAGLGMALGGVLPGLVFDITGGYALAIWLSAGFSLFGALSIVLLEPTRRLLIPRWEEISPDSPQPAHAAPAIEAGMAD
jgi:MFS family permease